MEFDSSLNPYYKYLITVIRSGTYVPEGFKESDESGDSDGSRDGNEGDDEHYLHPSLLGSRAAMKPESSQPLIIPPNLGTPDEDNTYSQLVKSLAHRIVKEESKADFGDRSMAVNNNASSTGCLSITSLGTQSCDSILPQPPADVQLIIAKLAAYVVKNGDNFEQTVRQRGEGRFDFLNPGNVYHAHYIKLKLQLLKEKREEKAAQLLANKTNSLTVAGSHTDDNCTKSDDFGRKGHDEGLEKDHGDRLLMIDDDVSSSVTKLPVSFSISSTKRELKKSDYNVLDPEEKEQTKGSIQEKRKRKAALFLSMLKERQQSLDGGGDGVGIESSEKIEPIVKCFDRHGSPSSSSPITKAITSPSASPVDDKSILSNGDECSHANAKCELLAKLEIRKQSSLLPFLAADKPPENHSRSRSVEKSVSERCHSSSHHRNHQHRDHHHDRHSVRHDIGNKHNRSPSSEDRATRVSSSRRHRHHDYYRDEVYHRRRHHRGSRLRSRSESRSRSPCLSRSRSRTRSMSRDRWSKSRSRSPRRHKKRKHRNRSSW